jgi:glutaredoxin
MITNRLFVAAASILALGSVLGENLSTGVDVDAYVEKMIRSYDAVVFAKSYCPYCRHTRELLHVRGNVFLYQLGFHKERLSRSPSTCRCVLIHETGAATRAGPLFHSSRTGFGHDARE